MERELLEKNLREMRARLDEASARWGRVEICAVTKTVAVETINLAYDLGVCVIGENRVQELAAKADSLNPGFARHMIGRLQLNKVKQVLPLVTMIQSLDRRELLYEIDRRAQALGNPHAGAGTGQYRPGGAEGGRSGRRPGIFRVRSRLSAGRARGGPDGHYAPGFRPRGSAAVLPAACARGSIACASRPSPGAQMRTLSMGMSADCIVAAEEGATMVRPGRALFGARI